MTTRERSIVEIAPTPRPPRQAAGAEGATVAASRTGTAGVTLAIVCAAVFMANLDLLIVNVAFPAIRADFGESGRAGLSWVLNGYAIVFAALLVPFGRLADRFGRRRGFLAGLGGFTLGSALCALAVDPVTLVAARLVQAAGAAALIPTSLGLLLLAVPPEGRAKALGIWASVGGMAAAAGPVFGGLLTELSWRWVFLVNLPVGAIAALAGLRYLAESRDPVPGPRPDLVGAGLLTAGIGAVALGLVQGPEWGWTSGGVLGSFVVAAIALSGFARRTANHAAPIVEPALLRVRAFAMANVAAACFMAAMAAMILGLVEFLTGVWGYSTLRAGLAISPGPLIVPLVAFGGSGLAARFGHARVAAVGALFFAVGGSWWALVLDSDPGYATGILPGLLLGGIGAGLTMPTQLAAGAASLPPGRFATGSAVFNMSRQIGAVLGVALLVALLGTPDPGIADDVLTAFDRVWFLMATAATVSALACLALGRVQR